jgi:hypothetical protein
MRIALLLASTITATNAAAVATAYAGLQSLLAVAAGWACGRWRLLKPDPTVVVLNTLVLRVCIPCLQVWLLAVMTDMRTPGNWRCAAVAATDNAAAAAAAEAAENAAASGAAAAAAVLRVRFTPPCPALPCPAVRWASFLPGPSYYMLWLLLRD